MKIKKIVNKITIPILCIAMELGNVIPAYAVISESDSSTYEEIKENVTKETEVKYEQSASYFVTIPKIISLGSDKQSLYAVKAEGDIPSDKQVYVSPIDGILSTKEFDFYMHDQNTKTPKNNVVATVTQSKFYWNFEEVADGYEETHNSIAAEGLSSGTWKGTFDFEINMHSIDSKELVLTTDGDVTMGANSTYQTNAYINGKKVNEMVEWESDNDDILVADGLLETKASAQVGDMANITVLAEDSPSAYSLEDSLESNVLSSSFKVTVIDIAFTDEADGEISSLDIKPGESKNVRASIVPDNVEGTVKWSTTATAGLNLVPNGNTVTIKAAEDMPTGSTYDVIATYGTYSKILKVNIPSDHEHDYVIGVTKEATYTEAGEKTIICTVCNESHTEEIPMLKDNIPATGSISISDNVWKGFLNTVTFDIFFKDEQDVAIEAEDKESGVKEISYYIAAEQIEEENLSSVEWTGYNGKFTIYPNGQYVIYVKITDNQNNVTYISSNGMVLDNIAPIIEGLEEGGTYEPEKTITVEDGYTLKVNGKKTDVKDGSYIFEEEGEYTISVLDKAGNETSITVTIQHTHNYVDNICTKCGERDPESINYVTLRSVDSSSSYFFGNSNIPKEYVTNISFKTSSTGHYLSDDNCWDVSDAQNGSILAWYTYNSLNNYYEVYFAPKNEGDVIRAPKNAAGLFSGIPNSGRSYSLSINGLNTVDFSKTTNFTRMFAGTKLYMLDFNVDTSSAEYMDSMFDGCSIKSTSSSNFNGLTTLTLSDKVTAPNLKSASNMFYTNTLATINNIEPLLKSIKSIYYQMFCYTKIKKITIPDNIETIGASAFYSCTNLTSLDIPNSVKTIGDNAFYNVPSVTLPCRFEGSTFGAKSVTIKHDYTSEIIKESTCTETGEIKYTCNDCGYSYTKSTVMKMHDYENEITKEPTCTEAGEKTYTCSMCGDSYTEVIPAKHNYDEDGYCTECGENYTETAPAYAYMNWNYTLDDINNVITLNYYTGSETDVIVYGNYVIDGVKYKTQLASNIDGTYTTNYMFNGKYAQTNCQNIKTIIFSDSINTNNVTDMSYMFYGCTSLVNLDINGFDTGNVTGMKYMFGGCSSLTELDVSNFDTINVTSMYYMFGNCSSLTNLNLGGFNTSNVTDMTSMFECCSSLTSLDLSNFNISNVTSIKSIFHSCSSLTELNLSNFDTSNVTVMNTVFYKCTSLTYLDLSSFDTSRATTMNYMFNGCTKLKTIYVTKNKWTTTNATTSYMFTDCGTSSVTYK